MYSLLYFATDFCMTVYKTSQTIPLYNLLHEYRDLFIDMAVRNNRSKLAIANRHQER